MKHTPLAALASLTLLVYSAVAAHGMTLTFDDVPSGTTLYYSPLYRDGYRVTFDSFFEAVDHTGSPWGLPHSGSNVVLCTTYLQGYGPRVFFGSATPSAADRDNVLLVRAYFSTAPGAEVRITAYEWVQNGPSGYGRPLTSTVIGSVGQSWDNVPVVIGYADTPFYKLIFEGVNSPNDLLGFCLDDMTITYVPEPSSVLVLCAGIGAMGAVIRRRRG